VNLTTNDLNLIGYLGLLNGSGKVKYDCPESDVLADHFGPVFFELFV
jgi:hypothetical protein